MRLTFSLILLGLLTMYFLRQRAFQQLVPRPQKNADLVKVVLSLEPKTLEDLFKLYAKEFGPEAAKYARRTYRKWKSGEVRPNKQTFNRLLIHLPDVMSFELKCEVLRKFREAYCAKDHYKLTVDTETWSDTLTPLVEEIINKSYIADLPKQVAERLRWLSAEDMQIARVILAESQAQESRLAASMLRQEFANIEELLHHTEGRGKVTHTIRLPFGTIALKIKRS